MGCMPGPGVKAVHLLEPTGWGGRRGVGGDTGGGVRGPSTWLGLLPSGLWHPAALGTPSILLFHLDISCLAGTPRWAHSFKGVLESDAFRLGI